jgi:hypothetical protein
MAKIIPMSALTLRLTKRAADEYVLTCVRPDGSIAQKHYRGPTAMFFPKHDLTHYVVETALGLRRGFYGLVAEGWNLGDFGTPWPRGKPPADADPVEDVVQLLDRETGAQQRWTAAEFNSFITQFQQQHSTARAIAPITEKTLALIREQIREFTSAWLALPVGQTMELSFSLAERKVLC